MNAVDSSDSNNRKSTESVINSDNNANKNNSEIVPQPSTGAIPKRLHNHDTTKKRHIPCVKYNNNVLTNVCKMGLGNGNDSNLRFINVTSDLKSFTIREQSCENEDSNFLLTPNEFHHGTLVNHLSCVNSVTKNCKCIFSSDCNNSGQGHDDMNFTAKAIESPTFESSNIDLVDSSLPGTSKDKQKSCTESKHPLSRRCGKLGGTSSSSSSNNSNSDTENEDSLSVSFSDEGCIYTYKGGELADLPDSFFSDIHGPCTEDSAAVPPLLFDNDQQNLQSPERSRESSPEMDFLEMDFDPGPSCEADSESSADIDLEEHNIQIIHVKTSNKPTTALAIEQANITLSENKSNAINLPSTSNGIHHNPISTTSICNRQLEFPLTENCDLALSESKPSLVADQLLYNHCFDQHLAAAIYQLPTDIPPKPVMMREEKEMQIKHFSQLPGGSISNAVLNALLTLNKIPPRILPEWTKQWTTPHLISDTLDLPQYLLARSQSFPNYEDLVAGLKQLSNGSVYCRFFATWPERNISLSHWLAYWLERNVVPIVTANQQISQKDSLTPEWQHHTVFGIKPPNIYMTDPVHYVSQELLWKHLTSDSVLLVKRADILSHWTPKTDLGLLCSQADRRWDTLNTVGKLVHLLRSAKGPIVEKSGFTISSHIPIPTSTRAGITLVCSIDNPACETLEHCPDLPLKIH